MHTIHSFIALHYIASQEPVPSAPWAQEARPSARETALGKAKRGKLINDDKNNNNNNDNDDHTHTKINK